MKIQEFRDKVKSADRAALEKIAADLYRRIPKKDKEDDVDAVIDQILKGGDVPKPKARIDRVPFPELEEEIRTFLAHVDAGYYIEPNRVVSKQKRSKWRFEVMRFLKGLDAIPADDENANTAAELYLEIYNLLAYGCGIYILPSEDPFASIGKRQGDFYPVLVSKIFSTGFTDAKITDMLKAATSVYIDRYTLYVEMEIAFIRELRTRDMREKAFSIAREEVTRLEAKLKQLPRSDISRTYEAERCINEICCTMIGLGIALYEEEDALRFFFAHIHERDKEVQLYIALEHLDWFGGSNEVWIKTYENAVKRGIKPRDRLREKYEENRQAEKS